MTQNDSQRPIISVICPSWNTKVDIVELLDSLSALDYPKSRIEVIIVDNASIDGSVDVIRNKFAEMRAAGWRKLRIIELPENIGIPGAYNEAYRITDKDAFAILRVESDVILAPDSLLHMVELMLAKEKAGVIGGTIKSYKTGENQYGAIIFSRYSGSYRVLFPDEPQVCGGVLGCCMLIRNINLGEEKDLFDSRLFIGCDETDLSFTFASKGYDTWYTPLAVISHKGGQSTGQVPDLTRYYSIRNNIILLRKHASWVKYINGISYAFIWVTWKAIQADYIPVKAFKDAIFLNIKKKILPKSHNSRPFYNED